ncbi:MAG: sigma-70 family RNA polymerase sigma factor [Alphaproteobacteria bacterium]|nr:sigma-70 family RNA polymerase sigma factor [Alphaproteobacteria bacterium]MCB9794722.1 sigma-70 family RNA polymerase sigma factor [Alphaproteobacteria bacterium]
MTEPSDTADEVEVLDKDGQPVDPLGEDNPKRQLPRNLTALAPPRRSGGSTGDLLNYYLSEVRRYPLLEPEEEKELAIQWYEDGDRDAAERLVTANLRLVVKLAFQYHRQWSNVLDLIQEGNVGLVEALRRYDPYRGIRFSSYAQYWIRAMILRFLMDNFRMVRLGSTRSGRKLFFQLQKEKERLIKEGLKPSAKLLAERLDVSEDEVNNVDQHLRAPAMSLHAPVGGGDEGRSLADVVSDEATISPMEDVAQHELGAIVREKLNAFAETLDDERERAIWDDRLTSPDPKPLSALGAEFGVSKERIRQVEARMRKRLRAFLQDELGEEIDFEFQVPELD